MVVIAHIVDAYSLLMLIWVIASWVPQIQRFAPVRALGWVCEPPLRLVRRLLPAAGGLDFSPMVVIIGLQLLARALAGGL